MKTERSGFFVVLDGLDGCGKTVQSKILQKKLSEGSVSSRYTAEPSSGSIGSYLKKLISLGKKLSPTIEVLLFAADRFDHLEKVETDIEKGHTVICDRYVYSSLAYQGAQGIDLDWIRDVNNFAPKPDISIYLDVDPETGLSRRGNKRSVFEKVDLERKVREIYLRLVREGEMIYIDSRRSINRVSEDIFNIVVEKRKSKVVDLES